MSTTWHEVAALKLTRVLGSVEGTRVLAETLKDLGLDHIETSADLTRFACKLAARGGFATAIAAMLDVHVAMYGSEVSAPGSTAHARGSTPADGS